jgi:hypothetical protein
LIFLYISLGIAALVLLPLSLPITVDIRSSGETLKIKLKTLFFSFTLYPRKQRPIKLSQWKIKRYRRRRIREQRKYLKKKLRKEAEDKRMERFAKEHPEKFEKAKGKGKVKARDNVKYAVDVINNAVVKALAVAKRGLRIKLYYLRVTVGGDEPDKTALTYGYVCQAVSYLNEILKQHTNVSYPGKTDRRLYVGVDFLAPKTVVEARISLKMRVWHLIKTAAVGLYGYVTTGKPVAATDK